MTDDIKKKLINNNEKITELLKENENLLIEAKYEPPKKNFALDNTERINIPSGYIRVSETFITKYHLNEIANDKGTGKNIAYSFQLSDFYNYMINRFYIWGSVKTMLCKSGIINLVAILEALILECANNICPNASSCGRTKNCNRHFNKSERNNCENALDKLIDYKVLSFSEDEVKRLKKIIDLRNRVHIRIAKENEFIDGSFDIDLYNETMKLLKRISKEIYLNGIEQYNKCID